MKYRCQEDVELNYKVAVALKSEGVHLGSEKAAYIEHLSQHLLQLMTEYGFALDVPKAHKLFALLKSKATTLEEQIREAAPDLPISKGEVTPKYKKLDGSLSKVGLKCLGDRWEDCSGPFTKIDYQVFNLDSPKQKVKRLEGWWHPTIHTKGYRNLLAVQQWGKKDEKLTDEQFNERTRYMWQLCEENFNTITDDAPQSLRLLGEYAMVTSRYKEIEGWLDALGTDDRVHGNVHSIGAITHRMSHSKPNMANIPGSGSPYGEDCRSCFTVRDPLRYSLLGCDASGIQLRILAHYMNDPDYTHECVNGDIHEKNLTAMGIDKGKLHEDGKHESRDIAKTFIYAWLLGAGDEKVGSICGGDSVFGRDVKETFLASLPSLAALKQRAKQAAGLGRLVGLDGRYLEIKSEHFALSAYLQGAESCIMKHAMVQWHKWVHERGLDARMVAVVHDEFQVETLNEHCDEVGDLIIKSIVKAGEHFKLNCPLDGEYKTGKNWYDTH
jgi:DNA polymerase-1